MNDERRSLLPRSLPESVAPPSTFLSPSGRARWKTRASFILILLTETLERTAFYGLICNMFMFLNSDPMSWASYNAATVIFVFNGIAYVTAVIGGWLADSFLGKFRTIVIFFTIYVVGFAFWPLFYLPVHPHVEDHNSTGAASWCSVNSNNSLSDIIVPLNKENCWWAVYLSIAIVGVGYGTVRVNIIPYGAFQVIQSLIHLLILVLYTSFASVKHFTRLTRKTNQVFFRVHHICCKSTLNFMYGCVSPARCHLHR